jgi:hypothetical protein
MPLSNCWMSFGRLALAYAAFVRASTLASFSNHFESLESLILSSVRAMAWRSVGRGVQACLTVLFWTSQAPAEYMAREVVLAKAGVAC